MTQQWVGYGVESELTLLDDSLSREVAWCSQYLLQCAGMASDQVIQQQNQAWRQTQAVMTLLQAMKLSAECVFSEPVSVQSSSGLETCLSRVICPGRALIASDPDLGCLHHQVVD